MPVSLPIQGDGFILREFLPSDALTIADIEFDPEVKRYLALPKKPRNEWLEAVQQVGIRGWVIETAKGEVTGSGTLERAMRKGDAELRIVIGRRFWHQALGSKVATLLVTTAFEDLSAKAIVAVVHPENEASLRLLRSLRFRRRGLVTEAENSWQVGHYIYRLPKNVYNSPLNRMRKKQRVG